MCKFNALSVRHPMSDTMSDMGAKGYLYTAKKRGLLKEGGEHFTENFWICRTFGRFHALTNEELQSTNEELETAKEELQSTNEELTTVNDELQHRNVELAETTDDLSNLFASVDVPIIMLGVDLKIRRFTPGAGKVMYVVPPDVGRP